MYSFAFLKYGHFVTSDYWKIENTVYVISRSCSSSRWILKASKMFSLKSMDSQLSTTVSDTIIRFLDVSLLYSSVRKVFKSAIFRGSAKINLAYHLICIIKLRYELDNILIFSWQNFIPPVQTSACITALFGRSSYFWISLRYFW